MALMPVSEALARLLDGAEPLLGETVTIDKAAWRVLAADIAALRTQPPFDASAMDGYAVRAADVASAPVRLKIIGEAPAGRGFKGQVGPGEAVRIFTGAPVPQGADAVLIQENTNAISPGLIEALEPVAALRNIRRAGLDFRKDEPLLEAGRILDAAALSLAAAANHATLPVVRRPLVAILATGDELLPPGSETGPDQIIASNAYGVAAIVERTGGVPLDLGIVRDDRPAIDAAVRRAIDAGADIIVTLGGASVGDHDLVREVLTSAGMSLDFWKIAMRPGKPLMFGRLGEVRVLGLPGNPVASLVCSHLFVAPLVARLAGRPYAVDLREAVLGVGMNENDQREDYVRARAEWRDGHFVASPFPVQDSSMLRTLAEANILIVRPPFAPASPAGSPCRVVMLR
ncbi:MAG: molybdopterin molybdotransferase MoeA [Mesorhizobium sp.]|nr:molybdopterin molybdotransferase MoeA [Mesorhizobium sp.]